MNGDIGLNDWKNILLTKGKISFSLDQTKQSFPALTKTAVKQSL